MIYYKVKMNDSIVDVLSDLEYVQYSPRSKMVIRCMESEDPGGVMSSDGSIIYHVNGWPELAGYPTVELMEISESEYFELREAMDAEGVIIPDPEPDLTEEEKENIEFVRERKVSAMSAACEAAIVAGFSVTDENGDHHFSLQVTDQIMIAQLALKAQAGADLLPWHADGEPCRFYSPEEILILNDRMEGLITYHQTYFNSLKQYILALSTIGDISQIYYGCDIPEKYRSEVLQALMKGTAE